MGRSATPRYAVRNIRAAGRGHYTSCDWSVKQNGKPTAENLARWVRDFEISTWPDGVNAHLGEQRIVSACIIDQREGATVATYSA